MVHIAAHAEANERSPLDSAIILSPGSGYRLYARDIIDTPLSGSTCQSVGLPEFGHAQPMRAKVWLGLLGRFSTRVPDPSVAGLWDVADESTAMVMDGLYSGVEAGRTTGSKPCETPGSP